MSIDLTLNRLQHLCTFLPSYTRPTIHIAGTNGKGSVSALLSSILLASSSPLRVGRYNSPHLITVRDCITIDNIAVTQDIYEEARQKVEAADRTHATGLSSFEILTMTALQIFEASALDIVVLEVGMGGRLDATNIVSSDCILVSALTAVDLDHQAFLGDTIAKIAREKAGIARSGKPFVIGKQSHAVVEEVVKEVVAAAHGQLVFAVDAQNDESKPLSFSLASGAPGAQYISAFLPCFSSTISALLPLQGAHQLENLGTALGVINALLPSSALSLPGRITATTVQAGIESVFWPGRLSFHTAEVKGTQILVLADGAHNAASAKTLGAYVQQLVQQNPNLPITYILGLSSSPHKTPSEVLEPLLAPPAQVSGVALLPFTPPEGMPWVKHVPASDMLTAVRSVAPELTDDNIFTSDESGSQAIQNALTWAFERHSQIASANEQQSHATQLPGLVVVAGSLYLVADLYRVLTK